jgi:hypothetical protein
MAESGVYHQQIQIQNEEKGYTERNSNVLDQWFF